MSDAELIARLRASRAVWENGRSHPTEDETEAAARIEALTAKLTAAIKLAELIRKYAGMGMNPSTDLQHMASDLLAILKGENQDGK